MIFVFEIHSGVVGGWLLVVCVPTVATALIYQPTAVKTPTAPSISQICISVFVHLCILYLNPLQANHLQLQASFFVWFCSVISFILKLGVFVFEGKFLWRQAGFMKRDGEVGKSFKYSAIWHPGPWGKHTKPESYFQLYIFFYIFAIFDQDYKFLFLATLCSARCKP